LRALNISFLSRFYSYYPRGCDGQNFENFEHTGYHFLGYEILFMLVSPDVDGSKAFLESMGVPIFTDIERYGELVFFTVKDPDGNVIMICSEVG
jgi:hypothetical protein